MKRQLTFNFKFLKISEESGIFSTQKECMGKQHSRRGDILPFKISKTLYKKRGTTSKNILILYLQISQCSFIVEILSLKQISSVKCKLNCCKRLYSMGYFM